MFDEDEEDQELLRHYEDLNFHGDGNQSSSSDELDSDLEDTIRSMVEYGSSKSKTSRKLASKTKAPDEIENDKVAAADTDSSDQEEDSDDEAGEEATSEDNFFDANEAAASDRDDSSDSSNDDKDSRFSLNESNKKIVDESDNLSDSAESDNLSDSAESEEGPRVTRVIDLDLDQPHFMDELEESEEERDLNDKLENLIQDQIERKQLAKRNFHVRRVPVCYSCQQPGHDARKCTLCPDCGAPKHESRCHGLKYCSRCKRRGHTSKECTYDRETKSCSLCGLSYHISKHCPSLVHSYRERDLNEELRNNSSSSGAKAFCYNCGRTAHYGDDCPILPVYLKEVPSAFSRANMTGGSRFDMKKNMKASARAFANSERRQHKRWADRSSSEGSQHEHSPSTKRSKKNGGGQPLDAFFERPSTQERHYQSNVRQFQSYQQRQSSDSPRISNLPSSTSTMNIRYGNTQLQRGTGNNNWNNIPKPTRSGTVSINQDRRNMDFPRNNLPPAPSLPRPSSSGVIDIPRMSSSNTPPSSRQPRFRGGYSRG